MSRLLRALAPGLLLGLLGTFVLAQGVRSQLIERPRFGLGYVANAPDAMAGASAYVLWPVLGGIGLYVDAKFDTSSPEGHTGFRGDLTADSVQNDPAFSGSFFLREEFSFSSVNVAVIRPVSRALFLYAGGGITWADSYFLFDQPQGEIGRGLWVAAPRRDETRTNLMGGIMMRLSSVLTTQFGYELQPNGVTAGVSLRLPPW